MELRARRETSRPGTIPVVLDLDKVAGIEELAGLKQFVGLSLGMGIEHPVPGQCLAFGVHAV